MVVLIRTLLLPMIRKYMGSFFSMMAVSCLGIALLAGLGGRLFLAR